MIAHFTLPCTAIVALGNDRLDQFLLPVNSVASDYDNKRVEFVTIQDIQLDCTPIWLPCKKFRRSGLGRRVIMGRIICHPYSPFQTGKTSSPVVSMRSAATADLRPYRLGPCKKVF